MESDVYFFDTLWIYAYPFDIHPYPKTWFRKPLGGFWEPFDHKP